MKKPFLFLNLFFLLFVGGVGTFASAQKKYRYIKREHGVRFQGNIPMKIDIGSFSLSTQFQGAYTYNWKGMLEVGPYFSLSSSLPPLAINTWGGGLLAEYNIIKNRGKRKFIPTLGLKLGAWAEPAIYLSMGPHGALKFFVGKRTPFIISLGYSLLTPITAPFAGGISQRINISMGFSYYFDFY